jgi:hypothetical protein
LNKVRGFGLYGAVDLPDQSSRDKVMTKLREQGEKPQSKPAAEMTIDSRPGSLIVV